MSESNGGTHPAATKQYTPRLVFWEVTKGCNLRCIHCRATATELMSPADLPTNKALDIISQIADFGNPILVLSGGEPLYRARHFPTGGVRDRPRSSHRAGHQRNPGDERRRAKDQASRNQTGLDLAGWIGCAHPRFLPRHSRSVRRRCLWHAQSSGIGSFRADQHHDRAPQRAPVAGRARPGAQLLEPMPCIPSCWCRSDAESISPPNRWCLRKSMSGC